MEWQVGLARCVLTPSQPVWLAGWGTKRVPEGKLHELWAKIIALQDAAGHRALLITTDHMGMSRTVYDRLTAKIQARCGLAPPAVMITYSHNHCGPILEDDLVDYYPLDDEQRRLIAEYSAWMEDQIAAACAEAWQNLQPAQLYQGEGRCTFAVNRRENTEADIAAGKPPKGVVDHTVPVIAIKSPEGQLRAVLFGYACHPTTLPIRLYCGDYPGWAQLALEAAYPGALAAFFNSCGADANPIPRGQIPLAEKYGQMLAAAVQTALAGELQPIASEIAVAGQWIPLAYEELVTREKLEPIAHGPSELHARWAKRMLEKIAAGVRFPTIYSYPVQVWRLGTETLFIALGGEAVVDYALRFKREFGPRTIVCGYANELVAYIPSRRVWEEGGYEGGPHLDEYGHPAWRWAGDVEERVVAAVHALVAQLRQ